MHNNGLNRSCGLYFDLVKFVVHQDTVTFLIFEYKIYFLHTLPLSLLLHHATNFHTTQLSLTYKN